MFYCYNKRKRLLDRCFRLLDHTHLLSDELKHYGLYDEYLEVVHHIELLFPVDIKKPNGHSL